MMLQTLKSPCFLSLLILTFSVFVPIANSKTQNFLPRGSSLSVEDESDLLISPDKTFTCGFYGLGENAYWFAIWFTNSKDRTVVWVANRDKPVNAKGSRVSLRVDGVMMLTDFGGLLTWETNNTYTNATRAELLDTGNLVLKDPNGKIIWQSFDFPTDTLLPYQYLTKSTKLISSLKNGTFQSGYFSLLFDNDNVLKMIYDGPDISSLYWPTPYQTVYENGRFDYNSSRVAFFNEMGTFRSSDQLLFSASDVGPGIKRRLTLDYDGNLRIYSLNNLTWKWGISWQALSQGCTVHGICGRNAICVYTPDPKCSCPPGYEVADPSDWDKGCRRTFNRTCSQSQEKFVQLPQVDYYGFDLNYKENISIHDCKELCSKDCRCVAFRYRQIGQRQCWIKNALFNGWESPNIPGSTYLKMPVSVETSESNVLNGISPKCRPGEAKIVVGSPDMYGSSTGRSMRWHYLYSFAAVLGGIEILLVIAGFWLFFGRRHGLPASGEDGYKLMSSQFRKFGHAELKKATENFKEELGRGASGAVYKGILADGRVVAVKRLEDSYQGVDVFWAEVSIIANIFHMNLVRMWGFCSEGRHRLLVYEYVEHLSLDKHLFPPNFLGWKERFKVSIGTAKGLAYLHHECLEWVIHCDVKPENILLGSDFEPKIADFGLAKLSKRAGNKSEFSQIRGTKGYMAPDWALNLPITAKVDVYSYGVVILEMVKGIRLSSWAVIEGTDEQEIELTRFVRVVGSKIECGENSWMEDAVDSRLNGEYSRNQVRKMVELGIACVQEDRSKRPTMDFVVQALSECEDEADLL
ncbi:putative receptor protein kinase ZmPK1 [Tripterygium wilfordii]|uniref:putative receptor protein kinase ZmPK1 n=1 Tax=Tripterygium wilfordii TaxID=458696 RepID=UPI0018F817C8|nr:putative receptor protein kinase ZmPK1 [Tripterygium wilfordii]